MKQVFPLLSRVPGRPGHCQSVKFPGGRHLLGVLLAVRWLTGVPAAQAQPSPRPQPDSALTRQALDLSRSFSRPSWEVLADGLRARPRPVWSYIDAINSSPRHRPYASLRYPVSRRPDGRPLIQPDQRRRPTRQLDNHMFELGLERRQTDFERLRDVLLMHATKVRRIKEAVPVLLFKVDAEGRVEDVLVDKSRSRMGLSKRSRKIILKALEKEKFQALEARVTFRRPQPLQERLHRLHVGPRLGRAGNTTFGWLIYKKVIRYGRCHEAHVVKVPRFWKE
jgi:hypothetical protein